MERNIKERVSQYVDENKVKEKLTQFFQEKIVNRKAMFIPITGVATFMLVGYAAADTKHQKSHLIKLRFLMEKNLMLIL